MPTRSPPYLRALSSRLRSTCSTRLGSARSTTLPGHRHRGFLLAAGREDEVGDAERQGTEVEVGDVDQQPAGLEAGDRQHVVDQVAEVFGLGADDGEELVDLGGLEAAPCLARACRRIH